MDLPASQVPRPLSDDELLLLLRGSWLAGKGDLRDPSYVARLKLGALEGAINDEMANSDAPMNERMLPQDEAKNLVIQEVLRRRMT